MFILQMLYYHGFQAHITLVERKCVIMGYVGDAAFLPGQKKKEKKRKKKEKKKEKKKQITTLRALGGIAFDSAYDIK